MAGKSDFLENGLLALLFNGTAIATIADNAASTPLTNLYIALHQADPTDAGNQTSSEANYVGYARVAVARTSGAWTVTGNSVSPVANIDFPISTGGTNSITHWSVGVAASGATNLLYVGTCTPTISVVSGVIPRLTTATTVTED